MSENHNNCSHDHEILTQTLLDEIIREKRSKRRWGIFFKSMFLLWLLVFLYGIFTNEEFSLSSGLDKSHTALIDIQGKIMESSAANADDIAQSLHAAFKSKGAKAIILRINSPGGTPVTADYIFNEIRRLKNQYNKKVYAVCMDMCASGAYYVAAAADEIYANPASFVGSIAVLYNGFGFVDSLNKLGVERRMYSSGDQKGFLDPFSPSKPEQVDTLKVMLQELHQEFINAVKEGRGERLKENAELFSGLFWTGHKAKELGLIDGFGSAGYVARDIIKEENIINYTFKPSYIERMAKQFGASVNFNLSELLPFHLLNEWLLKQHK